MTGMLLSGIAIIYTPRRFPMIMRRTIPTEPSEPVEPAEPLSHAIKGRHALWANPELCPISSLLLPDLCYTILVSDFTNSIPAQRKGLAVYPEGYTLSPFSISSMHISNPEMHSCAPHDTINQMYAGQE